MTSFEYHLLSCLEGRIPTILKKTVFSIGRWDLHLEAIRGSLLAKKLKKLESAGGGSIDPTLPPPTNKEALTTRQKLRHPVDNFVSIRRPNEATCVFVLSKSCTADTWPHLTALVTIARHENIVRL